MFNIEEKTVLILSPHTDDGELTAGGTIARFIENGADVHYIAFSSCEKSVPGEFACDVLIHECMDATRVLGIPEKNMHFLDYEVREFQKHRQEILDDILGFKKDILPGIVFTPSSYDVHQDHGIVHDESIRAFKKDATILGMEHPWNNLGFKNDVNIILSEENLATKIRALQRYVSQANRTYFSEEYVRALARTHGLNVNSDYAESFECIRIRM